ncbi:MAG: CshA/CshB family fibrillar adhesin-related protein [Bacteroidota bacterium]
MPEQQPNKQKTRTGLTLNNRFSIGISFAIALAGIVGIYQINSLDSVDAGLSFNNVAVSGTGNAGTAIAIGGSKDGGFAWGDINQDGYLDLAVNTNSNSTSYRTRIFISDPTDPANPTFTDETETLCKGCRNKKTERSLMLADINHDGALDLVRNTARRLEVYLNQGAANNYAFGVGTNQTANLELTTPSTGNVADADIPGGMNTEGVFLADFDNDGWLDIIIENHNYGIDIYQNPADGSAGFTHVDPTTIGLPVSATDGDYGTCVDFDDDGDIDIIARKRDENDFFVNGGGTFTMGQDIGDAFNSNKGGVVFADFDNDGDFDLYWTDNDVNQIWLNDGTGTLAPSNGGSGDGEPWASALINAPASGIDGAAVGDVNNDGKVDLFLSDDSGDGYLFLNYTPDGGSLSFSRENSGIDINGNGEGVGFADYDNDGDLDLYINVKNKSNQLWRNALDDDNYLKVDARISLSGGIYRSAVGANVILKDCQGNVISGIREVPTTSGHGTDAPDLVHFGLPYGPDTTYNIEVRFVTINGIRKVVERSMTPSDFTNQTVVVYDTDASLSSACQDADKDGVLDNDDIDDDDDGIPDAIEQYCENPVVANSTSGSGTFQDNIYWFNWTDSDFSDGLDDGDSQTFNLADGTQITATISNVVNLGNQGGERYLPDDMNTTVTASLHTLYNSDGSAEVFHSPGSNSDDVSFAITFAATKNGKTVYPDYILVDGESTNGSGEYIKAVSNQGNWKVLEHYGAGATFTGTGTQTLNITDTGTAGTGNTVFYVENATVFSIEINSDGGQAVGFGIYLECDSDGDGIYNHLDLDADNDGIPDIIEAGGADVDGDGMADDKTETDGDGLVDIFETAAGNTSSMFDKDGNGANENNGDLDGDGFPNWADLDADGDGIVDVIEAGGSDSNNDGLIDGYDTDSDGDGYGDAVDGDVGNDGAAENSANAILLSSADTNSDGLPDGGYPNDDSDSDGRPDHLDIDADGDGIVDNSEAQETDDYEAPSGIDDDRDGIDNTYDDDDANFGGSGVDPEDTDTDSTPDYLDEDSDGDLRPDNIEGHDSDLNNTADAGSPANTGVPTGNDIDEDGLDDGYDNNTASTDPTNASLEPMSHPANDGGSDRDWRVQVFFPVEWLSFDARWMETYSMLSWSTAQEINSSHFQIQRRSKGQRLFETIGSVEAAGNSQDVQQYEFRDLMHNKKPRDTRFFYRIKQIDIDGAYDYSKVVELSLRASPLKLKAYPNPAIDFVNVEVRGGNESTYELRILNTAGTEVYKERIENPGVINKRINIQDFPAGTYVISIETETGSQTLSLIKTK